MNKIKTEADITGPMCREMRKALGLSQTEFWASVGSAQNVASRYELGKHPLSRSTRILIYLVYVAGVKVDASSRKGAVELYRLAELQRVDLAARAEKGKEKSNG